MKLAITALVIALFSFPSVAQELVQKQLVEAKRSANFEKLKRIDLQLQLFQAQVEKAVQPIIAEKQSAMLALCSAEKLNVEDCEVDANAGTVKAKQKDKPKEGK